MVAFVKSKILFGVFLGKLKSPFSPNRMQKSICYNPAFRDEEMFF